MNVRMCCLQSHPGPAKFCQWSENSCPCNGNHHQLLHDSFSEDRDANMSSDSPTDDQEDSQQANHAQDGRAFIQVGQCIIHSGKSSIKANCLIDLGCDHTSITEEIANELEMPTIGEPMERKLSVMSGKKVIIQHSQLVKFSISACKDTPRFKAHGIDYRRKYPIQAYTMPNAVGKCPVPDWTTTINKFPHLKGVDPVSPADRPLIDLVLGCDYAGLVTALESRSGKPEEPAAHLLRIGWVLFGHSGTRKATSFTGAHATTVSIKPAKKVRSRKGNSPKKKVKKKIHFSREAADTSFKGTSKSLVRLQ